MLDVAFCFLSVLDLNFKDVVVEIKTLSLRMTREEPIFLSPRFLDHCHCHERDSWVGWGWDGVRVE